MKNESIKTKVLVIEDEDDWMEKITKYLKEEGFLVFQAKDYASAQRSIESREKQYVDLAVIILDLKLPDGNGMNLLELIRPLWERDKTKVVIATSEGWTSEHQTAQAYPYYSDSVMKNLPGFKVDLIGAIHQAVRERENAKLEFGGES